MMDNDSKADLVLHSGKIYTLDRANPWAEAIAIGAGRVPVLS